MALIYCVDLSPRLACFSFAFIREKETQGKAFRMARVEKNDSLKALRLLFPLNNGVLFRRLEEQGAGTWESSPNALFREASNAFPHS